MAEKILVADDSLTIQKVVAITLANEPWVLVEATDDSELLGKLRGGDFRLVLLDFNLSETKSGYDLAREIKKLSPQTAVMAMLGTFDTVEDSKLSDAGIDGKIVKPFDSQKFIQKCREMIEEGASNHLSAEEEASLDFSSSNEEVDETDGWVMDAPKGNDDFDTWEEDTSPGIEIQAQTLGPSDALSSELEGWGVNVPDPIGVKAKEPIEIPPVIASKQGAQGYHAELVEDISESNEIQFQVTQDGDDTVYPDGNDLDYPDFSSSSDDADEVDEKIEARPSTNLISLDALSDSDDDEFHIEHEVQNQDRPDLAKEIESELSPDDFWAVDDENTKTIEISDMDSGNDENDDDFIVGVGDPQAPVEPVKTGQKHELNIEKSYHIDEDRLVEKVRASLAPMIEEIVRKYMDEKVEKVAWEIIPDVAENLIRKEIKEISAASNNS